MKVNKTVVENFIWISFLLSCLLSVVYLQNLSLNTLTKAKLNQTDYKKEENIERVQLSFLRQLPSFGFDNLIANWTMLRFIQYFGDDKARKYTSYSLSPEYLEVITKNDPHFISAYLIISPASSMYAGRPDRTVTLMDKGLKQLSPKVPNAYFVWLYKGVDELLFLGDIKAAKQSYQMAANWANASGDFRIAKTAQNTVDFLSKNPNSKQAQVGAWYMVFINSTDEKSRQLAKSNIEKLGGQLIIEPNGSVIARPPKID